MYLQDIHVLVYTGNVLLQMLSNCRKLGSIDANHGKVVDLLPIGKGDMICWQTITFPRRLRSNKVRATTWKLSVSNCQGARPERTPI